MCFNVFSFYVACKIAGFIIAFLYMAIIVLSLYPPIVLATLYSLSASRKFSLLSCYACVCVHVTYIKQSLHIKTRLSLSSTSMTLSCGKAHGERKGSGEQRDHHPNYPVLLPYRV